MNSKHIKHKGSYPKKCHRTTEIQRRKTWKANKENHFLFKGIIVRLTPETMKIRTRWEEKILKYGKKINANLEYYTQKKIRQWNERKIAFTMASKMSNIWVPIRKMYKTFPQKEKKRFYITERNFKRPKKKAQYCYICQFSIHQSLDSMQSQHI